jgi:hypothetical protein
MAKVHDECIDDSMYSLGWLEASTASACTTSGCVCRRSGSCKFIVFNHFMYREEDATNGKKPDQFDFPIYITNGTADELSVEEVRCKRHVVGSAYDYYNRVAISDPLRESMISVFLGDYKSTCFNMSCFLLEMKNSSALEECLHLSHEERGFTNVLARGYEATASLLEAMCMINVDPIVSPNGQYSMQLLDRQGFTQTLNVCTAGFLNKRAGSINVLGSVTSVPQYVPVDKKKYGVRAVRTALVTMSVVLTPKSLYGGKNPTTKIVSYYVHNVKIQ